jgi:hypothetical protein
MRAYTAGGLFLAWAIHDAEEWFTIGPWSRNRAPRFSRSPLARVLPWAVHGVSDRHVHVGIMAMGALIGGASLLGQHTQGESRTYRAVVEVFGFHGLGHLAASAALRGYTPGVATTPVTVLPYAVWTSRRLTRRYGPVGWRARLLVLAAAPVSLAACHAVGSVAD